LRPAGPTRVQNVRDPLLLEAACAALNSSPDLASDSLALDHLKVELPDVFLLKTNLPLPGRTLEGSIRGDFLFELLLFLEIDRGVSHRVRDGRLLVQEKALLLFFLKLMVLLAGQYHPNEGLNLYKLPEDF